MTIHSKLLSGVEKANRMNEKLTIPDDYKDGYLNRDQKDIVLTSQIEGKSFGPRAVAYIIDTLFVLAVSFAVTAVVVVDAAMILVILYPDNEIIPTTSDAPGWLQRTMIGLLIFIVYYVSFEALYGATLGKLMMGMRVIREKDGKLCDFKSALIRGLIRPIDGILFGAVAYFSMGKPLQ